jgi:hypothetical protein
MDDPLLIVVSLLGYVAGFVLLIISIRKVNKEEAAGQGEGLFHPVSIIKFFLLSTISLGIYSLYWFWRCWRRYRITEGEDISPFWRAFFSIFWIIPLFRAANDKADTKWPIWIPVVCVVISLITSISLQIAFHENIPTWQTEPVAALATLGYVPLIMQINRINILDLVKKRARFSKLDWCAVVCGTPLWLVLLFSQ